MKESRQVDLQHDRRREAPPAKLCQSKNYIYYEIRCMLTKSFLWKDICKEKGVIMFLGKYKDTSYIFFNWCRQFVLFCILKYLKIYYTATIHPSRMFVALCKQVWINTVRSRSLILIKGASQDIVLDIISCVTRHYVSYHKVCNTTLW